MTKDIVRAIGYINGILAECSGQLSEDDVDSLRKARRVLQLLLK